MSESTADQDRIETDLARTRARMDGRLSELQDRLSPGQILDDLMAYFRGSDGGDFARNLMASVKNNPMPAALTGIGLAWLMASDPYAHPLPTAKDPIEPDANRSLGAAARAARWSSHAEFDRHIINHEAKVIRGNDEPETAFRSRLDDARGEALGVVREAQDTAELFSRRVQDAIDAARKSVTETAEGVANKASAAASQVSDAAGYAGDQISRGTQAAQQMVGNLLANIGQNPVLLGALGLTVGAVLGALVPQSEQEQAALGDVGRHAREGVSDLAQAAVDGGATVARQVIDAGREAVSEQGLADKSVGHFVDEALKGNLVDSLRDIATVVVKAGDSAVREAGLGKEQDPALPSATFVASPGSPAMPTTPAAPTRATPRNPGAPSDPPSASSTAKPPSPA